MKTERILVIISLAVWMGGCYTQFATLEDRYSREPGRIAEDSTGERTTDTVVIKERETCYWHRTFFGDWELRCYETNYSDEWYSYYHRPWWYHQSSHYFYDCSCPYHIMYNPHCDYCWYYCNKYHHMYIHDNFNTGSTSTGTGTSIGSGKKKPRPPIHPVTTGGVKGSGTGANATVIQQDDPVIVEIGEDDNNSQNTIIKTGKKLPGSKRPPLKPSTAQEKKKAILSGDQNVKNKGVLKENVAPKKTGGQGKGKELITTKPPDKKEDIKNEKKGPRKRRSLRGK